MRQAWTDRHRSRLGDRDHKTRVNNPSASSSVSHLGFWNNFPRHYFFNKILGHENNALSVAEGWLYNAKEMAVVWISDIQKLSCHQCWWSKVQLPSTEVVVVVLVEGLLLLFSFFLFTPVMISTSNLQLVVEEFFFLAFRFVPPPPFS